MRRLTLRRETLAALTSDELTAVNGGSHFACTITHGPSIDERCPTVPLAVCTAAEFTARPCITDPFVCTV